MTNQGKIDAGPREIYLDIQPHFIFTFSWLLFFFLIIDASSYPRKSGWCALARAEEFRILYAT
jgi:hypothetical protein